MQYVYFPSSGRPVERNLSNPAESLGDRMLGGHEAWSQTFEDRDGRLVTAVALLRLDGSVWCLYVS